MNPIGDNIKLMRRKCGFTQEELAALLSVTPQVVPRSISTNKKQPNHIDFLIKYDKMNITVGYYFVLGSGVYEDEGKTIESR